MITIRLKKIDSDLQLSYLIVVSSHKVSPKSNKFLEKIGFYKPLEDKWSNKYVFLNFDRLVFWLNRGAKLNKSVFLLIRPLIINSIKK